MNFVNCRSVLALFTYCVAVMSMIVNGQPTIDDHIDEGDTSKLIMAIAELRAEVAKLKGQLSKPSTSKFSAFTVHYCLCDYCCDLFRLGVQYVLSASTLWWFILNFLLWVMYQNNYFFCNSMYVNVLKRKCMYVSKCI